MRQDDIDMDMMKRIDAVDCGGAQSELEKKGSLLGFPKSVPDFKVGGLSQPVSE